MMLLALALSGIVLALASIWMVPRIICRLPPDYLHSGRRGPLVALVARNLLGAGLTVAGLIMLVTPGQGLLTLGLGLMLMDYPGKKWLLRRILSLGSLRKAINGMRAKRGHPPLQI